MLGRQCSGETQEDAGAQGATGETKAGKGDRKGNRQERQGDGKKRKGSKGDVGKETQEMEGQDSSSHSRLRVKVGSMAKSPVKSTRHR